MRTSPGLWVGAFAPFIVVSVLHLAVKLAGLVEWDRWTKGLTMPALLLGVVIVLLAGRLRLPGVTFGLLTGALVLSWIGDLTLSFFEVGLSFFLAAHLLYIALFLLAFRRRISWWALGIIPWFAGLLLALAPFLGESMAIVAVYGAVLGVMAAASTRGNAFTMLGGTLFVASDSLLAFRIFTPLFQTPPEDVLIMGLYLAAQFCIALGVLRLAVPTAPRPPRQRTAAPA